MSTPAVATERLQAANACHDDDPERGAALLREIDPAALDPGQRPLYAFLLNHVLAEKLPCPDEAWQRQRALLDAAGEEAALPLLRHAAAAARLAGDAAGEGSLRDRLAFVSGTSPAQADELIGLAAVSFQLPRLVGGAAGEAALAALRPLLGAPWQQANGLDATAAVLTNNIASDLAERPVHELAAAALREAAALAAELAQGCWHRAGQWLQHERAHYLRALVANALGDCAVAEQQARAGLLLLDHHDGGNAEAVDRAFLQLELAHALARQGHTAQASLARAQADALAQAFEDEGLAQWYERRVARQQALDAAITPR